MYLLEHSLWVPGATSASMDTTLLPCQVNSPEEKETYSTGGADVGVGGRKPRTAFLSIPSLSSERLLWAQEALDQPRRQVWEDLRQALDTGETKMLGIYQGLASL